MIISVAGCFKNDQSICIGFFSMEIRIKVTHLLNTHSVPGTSGCYAIQILCNPLKQVSSSPFLRWVDQSLGNVINVPKVKQPIRGQVKIQVCLTSKPSSSSKNQMSIPREDKFELTPYSVAPQFFFRQTHPIPNSKNPWFIFPLNLIFLLQKHCHGSWGYPGFLDLMMQCLVLMKIKSH